MARAGRLRFSASCKGTVLYGTQKDSQEWEIIPVAGITLPADAVGADEDYFRPGRLNATNNVYRWVEAIHTGQRDIAPRLTDGWRTQQVIDAVLQASAERRWVDIEAG